MSRATEAQIDQLGAVVRSISYRAGFESDLDRYEPRFRISLDDAKALRALLAERAELLKDRAFADWFEENQKRITLEGSGCICVEPEDQDSQRDWECFQVGDNGRCVYPTIPVNPTLRKTVAYLIAATPPKIEAAKP